MKYRKKPVEIDAVKWYGFELGPHDLEITKLSPERPGIGWIGTLEGGHEVTPCDWIITGVKGEKYPCKPDIFELTYELVEIGSTELVVCSYETDEPCQHQKLDPSTKNFVAYCRFDAVRTNKDDEGRVFCESRYLPL